ncbi:hypothetical protein IJJ12_03775 [bacterium]|nr:hypothetical protein [bacterium]
MPTSAPLPPLIVKPRHFPRWAFVLFALLALAALGAGGYYWYGTHPHAPADQIATEVWQKIVATPELSTVTAISAHFSQAEPFQSLSGQLTVRHHTPPFLAQFTGNLVTSDQQTYPLSLSFYTHNARTWLARTTGVGQLATNPLVATYDSLGAFPQTAARLDDVWWLANVSETIHHINEQYATAIGERLSDLVAENSALVDSAWNEAYECTLDQLSAWQQPDSWLTVYRQHPFLTFAPLPRQKTAFGHLLYTVTIDAAAGRDFFRALATSPAGQPLAACWQNVLPQDDWYETGLHILFAHLPDVTLDIDIMHHTLSALTANYHDTTGSWETHTTFTYPAGEQLTAPGPTQPLTTLSSYFWHDLRTSYFGDLLGIYDGRDYSSLEADEAAKWRNWDRVDDLTALADTLEDCYDPHTDVYLPQTANIAHQTVRDVATGPYSARDNDCLTSNVLPAHPDFPYSYTAPAHTSGQTAGYALCAKLEPTTDWLDYANSVHDMNITDYHGDGTWEKQPDCTATSTECYFCIVNAI